MASELNGKRVAILAADCVERVELEVVTDEGLVSSRSPDDLRAFCAKVAEKFAEGRHDARVAAATGGASS